MRSPGTPDARRPRRPAGAGRRTRRRDGRLAAGIVTAAALGDRYGRRRIFATGLGLFTAASAACALAPTAGALVAARAVQGIGAAIVIPLSLTILTGAFPPHRRGAVMGVWGGLAGIAVAGGPLVGGAVTEGVDWHWIFWINVPIGLLAAVAAPRRLAETRGPAGRLDLPGLVLVCAAAAVLLWALVRGPERGWGSPETVVTLIAGGVLLGAFVAWERRSAHPMLPPALFRSRAFAAANATSFLMTAALMAAVFLASQYFQTVLGYSPLGAGLRFLPWTATPLLVTPAAGALSDRVGRRPVMAAGMLLQAAGLGWCALVATATVAYGALVAPLLVAGVGVSMVLPTAPAAALGAVDPAALGKASGANNTLQRFGGAFGIAVATAVFTAAGHPGTPAGFTAGFRPALALTALFSAVGAVTALAASRARRTAAAAAEPVPVNA